MVWIKKNKKYLAKLYRCILTEVLNTSFIFFR